MEKVLTRNIAPDKGPTDMAAYEANGGYSGLRKAMSGMSPDDCREVVSQLASLICVDVAVQGSLQG